MEKKDNLKRMVETGQRVSGMTRTMVAILSIITLLFTITPLSNANECRFDKSKTPWQQLTTVLDKYGVDTVGMNVLTPIPVDIIRQIEPDITKTIGLKRQPIRIDDDMQAGDFLCFLLQKKYQKRSGEKYDYYRVCYSTDIEEIFNFLVKYPKSKKESEMRLKCICLDATRCFYSAQTWNDYSVAHDRYNSVICPYEGFVQLAEIVNLFRVAVEDWDNLLKHRIISENTNCDDFINFRLYHPILNWVECSFIEDSINSCTLRRDYAETLLIGTIDAYRDFITSWPGTYEAEELQMKVSDYNAFAKARESGTHAAYMNYLRNFPEGDSADVAMDCLRTIEEPDWRRTKRDGTWEAFNAFEDKYPFGYYYDEADEMKVKILERIQAADINQDSFELIGLCSSPDSSVVIIGNIVRSDARYDITLTSSSTGKKLYRSIRKGEIAQMRVLNGKYRLMIEARNTETHYGEITIMGGMYGQAFYIVQFNNLGLRIEDISQESMETVLELSSRAIEIETDEFQRREEARMEKRASKVGLMAE